MAQSSNLSDPSGHAENGARLWRVGAGLLTFYAVALLLNAGALHENASRMAFGPARSFWMALSEPVAKACATLGLDRPRGWLEQRLGKPFNAT